MPINIGNRFQMDTSPLREQFLEIDNCLRPQVGTIAHPKGEHYSNRMWWDPTLFSVLDSCVFTLQPQFLYSVGSNQAN